MASLGVGAKSTRYSSSVRPQCRSTRFQAWISGIEMKLPGNDEGQNVQQTRRLQTDHVDHLGPRRRRPPPLAAAGLRRRRRAAVAERGVEVVLVAAAVLDEAVRVLRVHGQHVLLHILPLARRDRPPTTAGPGRAASRSPPPRCAAG
jgi:hypothetical protein